MSDDSFSQEVACTGPPEIDYSELLKQLETATLFDLYRLSAAIDHLMKEPDRIARARKRIRVGDEIEYFDLGKNRCVPAVVLSCNRTRAVVRDLEDGKRWKVEYGSINVDAVDTSIHQRRTTGLGRNEVSVGDRVGFLDKQNQERYGTVTRLNPKTVTLRCEATDGRAEQWRVAYSLLFRVLDGECEQRQEGVIEAIAYRPASLAK